MNLETRAGGASGEARPPRPLLVEILVEELPPRALRALGDAFAEGIAAGLKAHGLAPADAGVARFATPRRLAVRVDGVAERAADRSVSVKLMPMSVGLTAAGEATPALLKKLAAVGADASAVPRLERSGEGKGETLHLDSVVPGATLADALQAVIEQTIAALPIPKLMQYQLDDGWTSVRFVRPAHGLVALHGSDVVPVRALGLDAGRRTRGHRFEARVDPIDLADAASYERRLREDGAVVANFDTRRAEIKKQLADAAASAGGAPIDDEVLLDEVTALVERPSVVACTFDRNFLAVPPECLILTMKVNQKYFPLLDAAGGLTERFLVVVNLTPADSSEVIEGNERVVRPRLADARFFYEQDKKRKLESRVLDLDRVVYQAKLGTQGDRVRRLRSLARWIAGQAGAGTAAEAMAERAAELAKADLLTDMVGEFPELQGVMGRYYAFHDGEAQDVAWAIEDHYRPRFSGDVLPRNRIGEIVAIADKLDVLAGLFWIGEQPTGDKDPYAMRRAALGVARILIERLDMLDLRSLIKQSIEPYGTDHRGVQSKLDAFIRERVAIFMRGSFSAQEVDAVMSRFPQRLSEVPRRLSDLRQFWSNAPEASALAVANKRVSNILRKNTMASSADQTRPLPEVEVQLLVHAAELDLHRALQQIGPKAKALFEARDYAGSLKTLSALRVPVDAFFNQVMVNAEDRRTRENRYALLGDLCTAMNHVADLSKLAA